GGGAILVATDGPAGALGAAAGGRPQDWAAPFGIEIKPNPLTAPADQCYRGEDGRPYVKPRPRTDPPGPSPFDLFKHEEGDGALPIATSHPHEMTIPNPPPQFRIRNL